MLRSRFSILIFPFGCSSHPWKKTRFPLCSEIKQRLRMKIETFHLGFMRWRLRFPSDLQHIQAYWSHNRAENVAIRKQIVLFYFAKYRFWQRSMEIIVSGWMKYLLRQELHHDWAWERVWLTFFACMKVVITKAARCSVKLQEARFSHGLKCL